MAKAEYDRGKELIRITTDGEERTIKVKDIQSSWNGISFRPENHAKNHLIDLAETLTNTYEEIERIKKAGGEIDVEHECSKFTNKQLEYRRAQWAASSRTMSSMITGPANFPVRRNEKRQETYRRRSEEAYAHQEKAIKSIKRKAWPHGEPGSVVRSNDPDALQKLNEELEQLLKQQDLKKTANKLARKAAKMTKEEYEEYLRDENPEWSDGLVSAIVSLWPQRPFPSFEITGINNKIKTKRARIQQIEAIRNVDDSPKETGIEGLQVVENGEEARIQLIFDGKPTEKARAILKRNGMRWAPSKQAWQRQLTSNARRAVKTYILPELAALEGGVIE